MSVLNQQKVKSSDHPLWSDKPVLRKADGDYLGRVLVEVWDGSSTAAVDSQNLPLNKAIVELQQDRVLTDDDIVVPFSKTDSPMSTTNQKFLGRTIIEFWTNAISISQTASQDDRPRIHDQTLRHLSDIAKQK